VRSPTPVPTWRDGGREGEGEGGGGGDVSGHAAGIVRWCVDEWYGLCESGFVGGDVCKRVGCWVGEWKETVCDVM
jgi:hypothetical protein